MSLLHITLRQHSSYLYTSCQRFYVKQEIKALGKRTRRGFFVLQPHKVPYYKPTDLTGFELRPYVSHKSKLPREDRIPWIDDISHALLGEVMSHGSRIDGRI